MRSILGIDRRQLMDWLAENSYPSYRADQILPWVYQQEVVDFQAMGNVPKGLREKLAQEFSLRSGSLRDTVAGSDGTIKFLLCWPDGAATETVLIPQEQRRTVCVSSQVGCPVGCFFCASGMDGLERSLEAAEMVEQLMWARSQWAGGDRISNVVIMGMGEPLANYENTIKAIRIINADWALGIGARHITLSTIGLPQQIRKVAQEELQITLAVSLHAADDQTRRKIIPWAKKFSLDEIFAAIDYYFQKTHREVTLEYVLLEGVNCSPADADKLAHWAQRSRCNVNLINYNLVAPIGFQPASAATIKEFMQRLQDKGVNVHLRQSHGANIDAACGQLRRRSKTD